MMSDSPIYVLGNLQPTFDPDSAVSAGTNLTAGAAPSLPHAIVVGPLLASIALGAVVGNALVVLSMLTNPKLRTITNRFVASLACADLSVGVLVMPLAIKVELTGTWRLGRTLCDVWTSFDVLLCTASILNLCAISVDRYVAVTRPLQTFTGSWRHRRVANAMITGAWLLAVVITCPPLFGWREPNRHVGDVCTLTQDPGYVVYSALGSFYVPMVVMLVLYGNIFKVTRNRLPADVRQRGGCGSVHLRRGSRRLESVRLSARTPLKEKRKPTTSAARATDLDQQRQRMNSEDSSAGSSGGGEPRPTVPGRNGECLEMADFECERQTPSPPVVPQSTHPEHPRQPLFPSPHPEPAAQPQSTPAASKSRRGAGRSNGWSMSVTRVSLRHLTPKDEWRRSAGGSTPGDGAVRRENKAAKTLAIVVGGFVVCWLPFFVLYVVEPFCRSCRVSDAVRSALTWLGYANSLVNPFIYATYNRHFRHSFWRLTIGQFFLLYVSLE